MLTFARIRRQAIGIRIQFKRFVALDSLWNSSFILGGELWKDHFDLLLALVKEYVVNIWKMRKLKLYGAISH